MTSVPQRHSWRELRDLRFRDSDDGTATRHDSRRGPLEAEWGTLQGPGAEATAPEGLWEPGITGGACREQTQGVVKE